MSPGGSSIFHKSDGCYRAKRPDANQNGRMIVFGWEWGPESFLWVSQDIHASTQLKLKTTTAVDEALQHAAKTIQTTTNKK